MTDAREHSNYHQLDEAVARELHDLCTRLYDQVITGEELAELNRMLDSEPAARKLYLRYVSLHIMLLTSAGKHQRVEAEALRRRMAAWEDNTGETTADGSCAALAATEDSSSRWFQRRSWAAIAVAASLLMATMTTLWAVRKSNDQVEIASKGNEISQSTNGGSVEQQVYAARLSYISPAARWQQPNDAFPQEAVVRAGNLLALTEGEVELTYSTGTKLLLIGPAEFVLEESGGKLYRGGLVASVTEEGQGFTIDTPNGKVVDLGTEFGVAVDDFGVSEVSVFQGKVEAFPQGNTSKGERIELIKGRGLQWKQDTLIPLDADLRRFAASVLDRDVNISQTDVQVSLVDRFRKAALDSQRWKTLGNVQTTKRGLRLLGDGTPGKQPYLISREQFDPALGPVTVTCDFRFADMVSADSTSFSILTRSADGRGVALYPWLGTLASCARWNYGSEPDSAGSILRAGVKLESTRELSTIFWSGFQPPTPGTPYRVVMRDDGVNMSFTISLRDKPSTSKIVKCRSLFRGETNYVALEGSGQGTTLIERVEISQDLSSTTLSSYFDFSSLLRDGSKQRQIEKRLLATLAPDDAVLILQDDFDAGQLDINQWSHLGDVLVHDGAVQLGQPNAEGHIDTWKARPYLLTRKPLDPNDGALTILGRISFVENFLVGYGASFAVMTRADDLRGHGPQWESSVLQRGVRANFWPAAWESGHNLEIHERQAIDTITLLATKGVQVDPKVRSYLFRVVDDGQSVTLTIVDPLQPEVLNTISSPATSPVNHGLVGFESCWGSPVTLDDVRIYQDNSPERDTPIQANDE